MSRRLPVRAVLTAWLLAAGSAWAGQIDSADFFQIRRGMTESELLLRAGQPDVVTYSGATARERTIGGSTSSGDDTGFVRFRRTEYLEVKQFHYVPDRSEHDPYLTVITLRGGLVSRIDRTKVFSRANLPEPPAPARPAEPVPTDIEIRRARAERTLEAAERYAATRNRLLEKAAAAPAESTGSVYRSRQDDGSVYFGDRPAEGEGVIEQ